LVGGPAGLSQETLDELLGGGDDREAVGPALLVAVLDGFAGRVGVGGGGWGGDVAVGGGGLGSGVGVGGGGLGGGVGVRGAGLPFRSKRIPSATADALHEPQSPMPITTTSDAALSSSTSSGAAG